MHTATWDEVVSAITGVKNRGSFSRTFTPTMNAQSQTGEAGYYSSVYVACNSAVLNGNAGTSQVLSGRTFYTTSLTRQTGSMVNVPNTSSVTLTSTDGRKCLNAREVWSVTNSDGQRCICLECPTTGYYTNTSIIRAPISQFGINIVSWYADAVIYNNDGTSKVPATTEYYGVNIPVSQWAYYRSAQIWIPALLSVYTMNMNTQVQYDSVAIAENHINDGGYLRVSMRVYANKTTDTWTVISVRLYGYYLYI